MTRATVFAALTVSAIAACASVGNAEAGGIRLGFGGPMASFIASPTHGGGGGSSYGRGAHCHKPAPQIANHYEPPHHTEVRRSEPKVARAEPKPSHQEKNQTSSAPKVSKVADTTADKSTSTNESPVGASGALALAQTDTAAATAPAVVDETTQTPAETVTPAPATPEVTAAAEPVKAVEPVKPAEVAKTEPAKDVGCKKFIPSVGVTIDVGCAK